MVLNIIRNYVDNYLKGIVKFLDKLGLAPWHISILGFILTLISMILLIFLFNHTILIVATLLFLLGGFMDALDGQLARFQLKVSMWGAFYDSFIDRIEEIMFIFGLLYAGILNEKLAFLYIVSALLISYCRARSESLGISIMGIGIMERAERLLAIAIAIITYVIFSISINIIFQIIIILNFLTIGQRILEIYNKISRRKPS